MQRTDSVLTNVSDAPVGSVIWITGFSGAGKSTVAQELRKHFTAAGMIPVMLDGDVLRAVLARDAAYTPEARQELAWIYARLCREIARQGVPVICATISMYHEVRAWNRANNLLYYEIYLKVPLAERVARDPKGLYAQAGGGGVGPMVGSDDAAEEPLSPDLIIENSGTMTAGQAAEKIWGLLGKQ
jgi:adenylylsulfate kinase-like enzyme